LLAYQDDDNYIKLVYGAGGRGFGRPGGNQSGSVFLVSEEMGNQKNIAVISMTDIILDNNILYFKLEKKGDKYFSWYSVDGKKFETVGNTSLVLKDIKAGIIVCEGAMDPRMARYMSMQNQSQQTKVPESPFEVSFDYFHIKNSGSK